MFIVCTETRSDAGLLVVVAFWVVVDARLLKKGGRVECRSAGPAGGPLADSKRRPLGPPPRSDAKQPPRWFRSESDGLLEAPGQGSLV